MNEGQGETEGKEKGEIRDDWQIHRVQNGQMIQQEWNGRREKKW